MTTSTSTSTSTTSSSSRSSFWIGCMTGSVATAVALWWWQRQQAPSSREDEDEESATHRLSQRSKSSALRNQNPHVLLQSTRSLDDDGEDPIHVSSFLTDLLHEMWDYLNVAGAAVIRDSVEPYFQDLPGPFKTLRFTKMDLGHSPIRMDNLKVRKIQDGMIQIDLDIVWNGHCDLQLQAEQNSMIQLGVKELKLSGPFSLWLKPLTNQLPIISAIQYAFINPPIVELKFTGLASVAESPLLTAAVRDAINASLLCVVLPNRMMYKMQSNNNYLDTYQPPVGVARVTAVRGRGFVIEKKLLTTDDIPDVYLNITFGANLNAATTGSVWRTQTIRDNLSPEWLESRDFLLHDHGQKLRFHAWDEDPGPLDADDDLGRGSALIQEILMCKQRRLEVELLHVKTQKRTDAFVTMQCDFIPWTTDLSSLNTTNTNGMADDHAIAGLLVVLVHRAFHIPIAKPEDAATFVKVSFGNQEFQTSVVLHSPGYADALNPKYEAAFEIPITAGMPITGANAQVTFQLILHSNTVIVDNNHGTKKNESSRTVAPPEQVLGSLTVHLDALRSAKDHTLTQTKPIGKGGASLEYRVSLSGVQRSVSKQQQNGSKLQPGASVPRVLPSNSSLESSTTSGIMNGTSHEEEPSIGRLRLTVVKGRGFKISAELFNIDVPDAFCTIRFGSSKELWTTSVQRNNCNPVWNESKEYSLQSHSQVIALEVLDKNERSYDPDLHVGSAKTTVGNVLLAGGSVELELSSRQGRPTTVFITLGCELL